MLKKMLMFLSILLINFNLNCAAAQTWQIGHENFNDIFSALREINFCIINKSDQMGSYFWASPGRSRDESEKSRTRIMVTQYNNLMKALGLSTIPYNLMGILGGTHYDISQIDMSFIDAIKEQLGNFLESQAEAPLATN